MFDDSFIEDLPSDPEKAGKEILDSFSDFHEQLSTEEEVNNYDEYLKALAILEAFAQTHEIQLESLSRSEDIRNDINSIFDYFSKARSTFANEFAAGNLDKYKKAFGIKYNKIFHFKFSDGDLSRIQTLINELRETINNTKDLDNDYKSRLLKRLERVQSELHKTVSDLDKFWGLIGDAGVAIGKFGKDSKPFVDRIREIADIVWRTQVRAEELPSGAVFPLLTGENKEEADE